LKQLVAYFRHNDTATRWILFALLGISVYASVYAAISFQQIPFLFFPLGVLLLLQTLIDFRPVYYLLFFSIPFSVEFFLGSVGVNFPDEPLMVYLSLLAIPILARQYETLKSNTLRPFHILMFCIIAWTVFTTLTSLHVPRSAKFLFIKSIHFFSFFIVGAIIIRDLKTYQKLFWAFFLADILVTLIVLFKHAQVGFAFDMSHGISYPFFPNAVIYSTMQVLILPLAWFARSWYPRLSWQRGLIYLGIGLILLSILFSYKRGAWLCTLLLPILYLIIRLRLFRPFVWIGSIVLLLLVFYLVDDNRFYRFATEYEQTIYHHGDLEGHLEATVQGKELSATERFYRWVAAKGMIAERPWLGFGPFTFNLEYQKFTDSAFRTYVSENEEQSTTHNYFLMTFSEQGIIGGMLFIILCYYMLLKGNTLYHRTTDPALRGLTMGTMLSLITIIILCVLNDLIEVDKIGPFFWLNLLMIHKIERWKDLV